MPEIEMLHVTWIPVTQMLIIHILITCMLYMYKGNDKKCLIRQRTYNITYNIHSTLSLCFFIYFSLNNIHRTYKDIHRTHIVWGGLLYAD